jgi:hypothetical protein
MGQWNHTQTLEHMEVSLSITKSTGNAQRFENGACKSRSRGLC